MPKILIIEADPFLSKLYTVKLKKLKYEVDTTMNGEEALQKMKLKKYDGILMELILPYRDGFALLRDIKKYQKSPAVIIATELTEEEEAKKAFDLGARLYYLKGESQVYDIIDALQALVEKKPLPKDTGLKLKSAPKEKVPPKEAVKPVKAEKKTVKSPTKKIK